MNKIAIFTLLMLNIILIRNISHAHGDNGMVYITNNNELYELSGKWFFKNDDKITYKNLNIDLHSWDLIKSNVTWTNNNKYKNYFGNAWYRINIFNKNEVSDLAIFIPLHYRGAQFYFNGELIYETRKFDDNANTPKIMGKPDIAVIPSNLIKTGKNVLAIRTGSLRIYGGFDGNIKISSFKNINKIWVHYLIWYGSLVAINIFITIYFLLLFFNRKNEKYYLFYALLSFSLGVWIAGYRGLTFWLLDLQNIYILSTFVGSILVLIMIINFLHSLFSLFKSIFIKIFEVFYIFLIVFVLFEYFSTGDLKIFTEMFYEPFILSCVFIFIYSNYLSIKAIKLKKIYSNRILIGTLVLTLSFLYSTLTFLDIINTDQLLVEGYFVMTVIFASVLASRFAKVHTELEVAHGELVVLDKMKDEFLATTSHELRTPLHGIIGLSETLLEGSTGYINDEQRNNLELINTNAVHLSRLVNDILDFSRVRNNKVDLYVTKIFPEEIIKSVVSLLRVLSESKEIKIITEIDPLPPIMADKNRIQQVLINLIDNAIKFTDQGEIKIRAKKIDSMIEISVSDTGVGIDATQFNRIWNPFEQLEDANTRIHTGSGLGLAISKELIEMHNGKIWVESERGKGSIFYVNLHIAPRIGGVYRANKKEEVTKNVSYFTIDTAKKLPEIFITEGLSKKSQSNAKILAVDDDLTNLQVIINICSPLGFKVRTCRTGFEAINIVKTDPPDLVLLDLMLPKMSGYEVCEKIREVADELTIPIIMLTARNQLEDMVKGFNAGTNDYLAKPFNRKELLVRIENQIAIKKMYEAEKNLKDTLNIFQYIVSSSGEHMCFIDRELNIRAVNDALLNALSVKQNDIIHKNITDFSKKSEFWKSIKEYSQQCLSGEEIHSVNWYNLPNLGRVPFEVSVYPYVDEEGRISGAVLNSRDVTTQLKLEMEILNISEKERRQIGMELHDGLSHSLLGIAIKSKILYDKMKSVDQEIKDDAIDIEKEINKAIDLSRSLARGLFPVGLENQNLSAVIMDLKNMLEKTSDINCTMKIDKFIRIKDINLLSNLYYIIQEVIRNIVKHSNAQNVNITVSTQRDNVIIYIHNDGLPLDKNKKKDENDNKSGGMGLSIMQYRARMIGATLSIENADDGGIDFICKFKNN